MWFLFLSFFPRPRRDKTTASIYLNDLPRACRSTLHRLQKKDNPPAAQWASERVAALFRPFVRLETPLVVFSVIPWTCTAQTGHRQWEWAAVYEALSTYKPLPGTARAAIHSAKSAQPARRWCSGGFPVQRNYAPGTKKHQTQQPTTQCCPFNSSLPTVSPFVFIMLRQCNATKLLKTNQQGEGSKQPCCHSHRIRRAVIHYLCISLLA